MSLILEALRKSEAERRRGQAPDVAMELPPGPTRRAAMLPGWVPPALLMAALGLLAAWWWGGRNAPDSGFDPVTAVDQPPGPAAVEAPLAPVMVARPPPVIAQAAPPPAPLPSPASQPTGSPAATVPAPVPPHPAPAEPPLPPPLPPPAPGAIADIGATALPPVRLSMHMWDEAPARRFAILDGQRMGEGDRRGDLQLVSIERDGVVIERNGQRARVPLP